MKIEICRALRGPNYFHSLPVIYMILNIGKLEEIPSNLIPNFRKNTEKVIPTLINHTCSIGEKGGFFERLERGTWAGHIVEHIAIELQNLIGHKVSYGKTLTLNDKGKYNVVFRYIDENVGLKSAEMAVEIVEKLFNGEIFHIHSYIDKLIEVSEKSEFGPSTQSVIDEAKKRGIPYIRLNEDNFVQLGHGKYQRRIQATITDKTSYLAVEIAGNKARTKSLLKEIGVPIPDGIIIEKFEEISDFLDKTDYPLVIKPLDGNHGRGVTTNITNEKDLKNAFINAKQISNKIIVEKFISGNDYRLLVINGKLSAAAFREPAYVIGNSKNTVQELIEIENKNPARGDGHENILTKIVIDKDTDYILHKNGFSLEYIPLNGEKIYVKSTSNISSGATAIDVTDLVHPTNKLIAEKIANVLGLDIAGIDLITDTLEEPLKEDCSGIVEVNAAPGFRMHLYPAKGTSRNVGKDMLDMLFPEGTKFDIPICAVTGTNGKTTTTRLISHILTLAGNKVGMSSTDHVSINNITYVKGDYSGPLGAETVMKDNTIDHAVLEVARGGIIRRGLGFNKCDVGVLLNVSSDHLGIDGIDTLEKLAKVKSTVTEAVKDDGYAIFNADDPFTFIRSDKVNAKKVFFSMDKNNEILKTNLNDGNFNITVLNDKIVIQNKESYFDIVEIIEIPITFNGKALFNIQNAMAATAAAYSLGVNIEHIKAGLMSFNTSIGLSPGRMNVFDIDDIKVIVDYGHNVGAIEATGEFLYNFSNGKKIRMASGVGDRRTEDILAFGKSLAKYSDYVVITDSSPRSRKLGETAQLVKEGLINGGFLEQNIEIILNEKEAVLKTLNLARSGDLVILQVEDITEVINIVLEFSDEHLKNKNIIQY